MNKTCVFLSILLLLVIGSMNVMADGSLRVITDEKQITVLDGQRPMMIYKYDQVPFKPYVKELFTPQGFNILRDAPSDHLHHHSLMFAFSVEGASFWEETDKGGKQVHCSINQTLFNDQTAGFSEFLTWKLPSDQAVLDELRTVTVHKSKPYTLLTWQSQFKTAAGKSSVDISGSHYYGLGMRFLESMDKVGKFTNSEGTEGKIFRGEERLAPAKWCSYTVDSGDHPVTVVMFDSPDNYRQATWFNMVNSFAYLSATMLYHEKPFKITEGNPLNLTYGVAVWDGVIKPDVIGAAYQSWIDNLKSK